MGVAAPLFTAQNIFLYLKAKKKAHIECDLM